MENCDLDECYRVALEVAKKAGKIIKDAFYEDKQVELKQSIADLVTETDQRVEKMIFSTFKDAFPTHSFIGEESTAAGEKNVLTDNPTWIVDPIDGTTNFVHRFPYTCVSIALLVKQQTQVAVIYNPISDEMYTARPGQGAYCNGRKLKVTNTDDLSKALICAEFGSSRDPAILDSKFRSMKNIVSKSHGIRSVGSAAVNMCLVAAGSVDAYVEFGIHCWDIAAGNLIVTEAGGLVLAPDGGPLDLMARRVLCAGTEKLAKQIAENIETIEFDRD